MLDALSMWLLGRVKMCARMDMNYAGLQGAENAGMLVQGDRSLTHSLARFDHCSPLVDHPPSRYGYG